jgi:integrase
MSAAPVVFPNLKRHVPTLRIHKASGQWIADLNGVTKYFGKDEDAAWTAFLPLLAEWREAAGRKDSVTVREAASRLAAMVAADCGHPTTRLAFAPLKTFCARYGSKDISALTVDDLEAFKMACQADLAPKTVNHWVGSAKRLVRYASSKGWRPPMETSFVRMVALPCPLPKHLSVKVVGEWLHKANDHHPNLAVWLRIMLATGARPSEVVRLVAGAGTWLEEGVFCFNVGKTNKTVRHPRCLVVQPEIRKLLATAKPQWKWQCTFSQACNAAFDAGAHQLRHTSCYLVNRLPGDTVSREEVDVWLGHYPGYVSLVYSPINWTPVKALADRYLKYLQSVLPKDYPIA